MTEKDFLNEIRHQMKQYKAMAEKALARVTDEQFFEAADNSLAIIVKHLSGSQRSRWTDFLTTDGEKPDRNRDSEFVIGPDDTREALLRRWEEAWEVSFAAVDAVGNVSLDTKIAIRSEPYTLYAAFGRSVAHIAYHVGQIVLLAKQLRGAEWESLSIPVGQSEQFNAMRRQKYGGAK